MSKTMNTLLALATINSMFYPPPINSNYTEKRERIKAEQEKALAKKQRVREEIRARRAKKEAK